jgi:flagellar basal body-associated protein FliL
MNSNGDGKPEPTDPQTLVRLLELELIQKRAARQQASKKLGSLRTASFLFLFLIILGAALAMYFVFSSGQMDELRARRDSQPSPSVTPTSPAPR